MGALRRSSPVKCGIYHKHQNNVTPTQQARAANDETGVEDRQWYLIQTHTRQEERTCHNLDDFGETLYARLRTRRLNQFTRARTHITEPLFPRYIFAKFDARGQLHRVRFTGGVHKVVCFANKPAVVHSDIIDIIRARMDQNGVVKISNELKPGEQALLHVGPLRDLIGIFQREVKGSERNIILLSAIAYYGPSSG